MHHQISTEISIHHSGVVGILFIGITGNDNPDRVPMYVQHLTRFSLVVNYYPEEERWIAELFDCNPEDELKISDWSWTGTMTKNVSGFRELTNFYLEGTFPERKYRVPENLLGANEIVMAVLIAVEELVVSILGRYQFERAT